MAFKASNIIPQNGYENAKTTSVRLKAYATTRAVELASGGNADGIYATLTTLYQISERLKSYKTIPGIAQYAKDQENDPAYDVAAEFNALIALVDDAISWIQTNLPVDGNNYLLLWKLNASNQLVPRDFSAAAVAPLVTKLNAIVAGVS